jgi:hypothetical protein
MMRQTITTRISTLELYHRRSMMLKAVRSGDVRKALRLCRDAMREAHYRAKYNCAPAGPEAHKHNFYAIREVRDDLRRMVRH